MLTRLSRIGLALVLLVSVVAVTGVGATAVAASGDECSFPATKLDATGETVRVDSEPERVVTLSPSAAQTMWEIGAKDKVVGVTKYATYLEGAAEKTNISGGGFTTVVVEKVVALNPDLVLAPNVVPDATVERLRDAGLTVYKFRQADSLEFIQWKTVLTGQLVGECEGAQERADWMEEQLSIVRETVDNVDRVRVLYTFSGGFTAGNATFIDMAIRAAGGTNVAADAGIEGYDPISEETIIDQDPEWIIRNTYQPEVPKTAAYNQTTAVQEGNVLVVNTNLINQPAPRIIYPIKQMVKAFHPEAYNETLRTPTPEPTDTPDDTSSTSPTASPSPDDGSTPANTATTASATDTSTGTPGFGVGVALVALVVVGLLGRRA